MKIINQNPPSKGLQALTIFLSMGVILFLFNAFSAKPPPPNQNNNISGDSASLSDVVAMGQRYSKLKHGDKKQNRLAIVIPYLPPADGAPTFPSYFDLFAMSAAGSVDSIDYLIFHCFIPPSLLPNTESLPPNVKLINLSQKTTSYDEGNDNVPTECDMAKLFLRVTDQREKQNLLQTPIKKLTTMISHQIINMPYILVEYKPAFGHIFADYLKDYSHWGYSDLDVVLGDMTRWISNEEWNDYDIVTYGFGDQDKLYLRGQFTFHKNDPKYINQLWRDCKYLSEMDVRYAHPEKLKFESAEGCYSKAVITKTDLKVKWAVKAFSDVKEGSSIYAHGMYLSLGKDSYSPRSVLYTASNVHAGDKLLSLPHDWFQDTSRYKLYSQTDVPIQEYVGEKTKVETYRTLYNRNLDESLKDIKCMYWAPQTYQMDICTVNGNVGGNEVVTLENGVLWKQRFETTRDGMFPEGIVSFPFFHFQEWKRVYRSTQLLNSHNIRQANVPGVIITKEGTLPLLSTQRSSSTDWNIQSHPWSNSKPSHFEWIKSDTGATPEHPSYNRFCLRSSKKGNPTGATICNVAASWPPAGNATHIASSVEGSAMVHLLRYPSTSKTTKGTFRRGTNQFISSSWWDEKSINANEDVTLVLTLQITSLHMKEESLVQSLLAMADSNIFLWSGQPSVLLIHVDSTEADEGEKMSELAKALQLIKDKFETDQKETASNQTFHLKNSLVAVVDSKKPVVSRKALMNMAMHAAPTRWIVSGLELERGLVLSKEASYFAIREAKIYADLPGHVFVIPQFASKRDDTRQNSGSEVNPVPEGRVLYTGVGNDLLPTIRTKQSMTSNVAAYDCFQCSDAGVDDGAGTGAGEELTDDRSESRRLMGESSSKRSVEEQIEDLWWDLSVADVYGTPGGFRSSLDLIAKIHDRIEVSLISLLDRSDDHLEYLRYSDKSPILLIDRLGPHKEMMTLDLVPEVDEFGGRNCFNLLRLAQLATVGYKVTVLPGAFAASYPKTRAALCTESIMKQKQYCDCDFPSESTIREILIDEVKRLGKIAVLLNELDSRVKSVI